MREEILSITTLRGNLLRLAKTAQRNMNRYILTNRGKAEAVLLGIGDYRSLVAAGQLFLHPEVLRRTHQGLLEIERGGGLTLDEALARLKGRKRRRMSSVAT